MKKVTAVFDIGKTNKEFLLFDENNKIVHRKDKVFDEIEDDDGDPCEDIEALEKWIRTILSDTISDDRYDIGALNFTTYGATLVYLDEDGKRVAPVYNYLKPVDKQYFNEFYSRYEGKQEFCRKTASPALGMLNSGLQIYWLKHEKPDYWSKVRHILHFPQYLSYLFTGRIVSEYTSIGCHTGMWNFDKMRYHKWLNNEGIFLPEPVDNSTKYKMKIKGQEIDAGVGIHDSSASLVPFFKSTDEPFLLISSGTWAINMNPFNDDNLTKEQLENDCLCYLSVNQDQVMASRIFLGHMHEVNVDILNNYFDWPEDKYKEISADDELLNKIFQAGNLIFFKEGIPEDYKLNRNYLKKFSNYVHAYHQLMYELSYLEVEQIRRIMAKNDNTDRIFISGGFTNNDLFVEYMNLFFEDKEIELAEINNGTALGAAMVME